jgi:hypothetical protein
MNSIRLRLLVGFAVLGGLTASARAGGNWSVGVRFGVPGYYRPYPHYHAPYYYRPYPVVVPAPVYYAPAPVVVQQQPVYVQPAPVVTHSPASEEAPAPRPLALQRTSAVVSSNEVNRHMQLLASADEGVRLDSVMQLGKLQDSRAVDSLAATLAGDRSAAVRDAAARALGLIGSLKALPALQQAAQADADRDVRRSAQFAAEVIQSRK